jgi:hypothetical protein
MGTPTHPPPFLLHLLQAVPSHFYYCQSSAPYATAARGLLTFLVCRAGMYPHINSSQLPFPLHLIKLLLLLLLVLLLLLQQSMGLRLQLLLLIIKPLLVLLSLLLCCSIAG